MNAGIIKYPIAIQTFEKIREGNYLYVDKTRYVHDLVNSGYSHVFLSRPRRFGKSLFVSTLQAYFEGRKDLFESLEIARYETEWESYPVLRFDFSGMEAKDTDVMKKDIHQMIGVYEKKFEVDVYDNSFSIGTRFGMLIQNIAEKTGKKVVVLIDEYDKGIVEVLQHEDQLSRNIDTLRPFYSQLKAQDANLKFAFLTGVSRFRNLTLFSSPNQLYDITMNPNYAALCCMTQERSECREGIGADRQPCVRIGMESRRPQGLQDRRRVLLNQPQHHPLDNRRITFADIKHKSPLQPTKSRSLYDNSGIKKKEVRDFEE